MEGVRKSGDGLITARKEFNFIPGSGIAITVAEGATIPNTVDLTFTASSFPTGDALSADIGTTESTTSTSFTDLATVGPSITLTVGTSGKALIFIAAGGNNNTNSRGATIGLSIGGAAVATGDSAALQNPTTLTVQLFPMERAILATGLTPGAVTFTMKYRADVAGTAAFGNRRIVGVPL